MAEKKNSITFKNDEEFFNFAVNPADVFDRTEDGILYHNWEFTERYKKAVEEGTVFFIEDESSLIAKRKAVCFRTICKPVENVRFAD